MKISGIIAAMLLLQSCARENVITEPSGTSVIESIKPARGGLGTQIRLYGTGFSTSSSFNTVSVNGKLLRVDSPSTATVLLATFIKNTGTGPVKAKVNKLEGTGPVFTWQENAPVITWAQGPAQNIMNHQKTIVCFFSRIAALRTMRC